MNCYVMPRASGSPPDFVPFRCRLERTPTRPPPKAWALSPTASPSGTLGRAVQGQGTKSGRNANREVTGSCRATPAHNGQQRRRAQPYNKLVSIVRSCSVRPESEHCSKRDSGAPTLMLPSSAQWECRNGPALPDDGYVPAPGARPDAGHNSGRRSGRARRP